MKWLLIIFVNTQLVGTVDFETEAACRNAQQLIEQKVVHPSRQDDIRMTCLPKGVAR